MPLDGKLCEKCCDPAVISELTPGLRQFLCAKCACRVYQATPRKQKKLLFRLAGDEDGASMVEYTVLLALITAATIGAVTLVGGWIGGQWAALNAALPGR